MKVVAVENKWGIDHLGLIPDGNRRWGRKHGVSPMWKAHSYGAEKIEDFLDWCIEANIPKVSIYTLSTENLDRDPQELQHIFNVLKAKAEKFLTDERIHTHEVKIQFLGKEHRVPPKVLKTFNKVMKATESYQKRFINFLVAYGGKYELVRSFNQLLSNVLQQVQDKAEAHIEVTPKMIKDHLLVKEPVDLVIRTGKEHRLSNFMLWQSSYAELYTTEKLWPEFEEADFYNVLEWYANRERRFGD